MRRGARGIGQAGLGPHRGQSPRGGKEVNRQSVRTLVVADEEQIDFDRELRADLLISCGDVSDSFILRVAEMTLCRHIFAVKGNHDSSAPFAPPRSEEHTSELQS